MILYLNKNWQENDGGELEIELNEQTYKISPTMGKCVFFKSNEIPHAVLTTQKNRLSITGWLKT
jgi:SM-20-related protein